MGGFLTTILIGGLAGWIAGTISKGKGFGLILNIIIGIVGGLIGNWLFELAGVFTESGFFAQLAKSIVGAIALLFVASLVKK